jgi:RNA polymerase sigma-70 factor (sigma-E family)
VVGVRNENEFDAFVASRGGALLRYAHVLAGNPDDAQDLLQSALVGTFRHWRKAAADPNAYARRAILNAHLNAWRAATRPRRGLRTASPPDPAHGISERDAMWRALAALPPRQRAVLVLRYYEDLDEAAIARVLGVSTGTVKSQASKALSSLRRLHSADRQEVEP